MPPAKKGISTPDQRETPLRDGRTTVRTVKGQLRHRELKISQATVPCSLLGKKRALVRVLVVVDLAADVGPEFFGYVAECVQEDVGAPDGHSIAEGALVLGMVGVGDAGGDGVAYDFGIIELELAAIG